MQALAQHGAHPQVSYFQSGSCQASLEARSAFSLENARRGSIRSRLVYSPVLPPLSGRPAVAGVARGRRSRA